MKTAFMTFIFGIVVGVALEHHYLHEQHYEVDELDCIEHLPDEKSKPNVYDQFDKRGISI